MGISLTTIIIAVLAGAGAYFAWEKSRAASIAMGMVCIIASASALVSAIFSALAIVFKILPLLLLAGGAWLVWRAIGKKDSSTDVSTR